eukprot:TRINITY_DN22632_c0_g1_i1.p1 TRINITY_DN22632_c0_g1~~TRINITY_DN22632_c0_g1_i1.p1  ORF type:complete len:310 (-),score=44.90 TRINITY_DN22632_c0_g1_i1:144-1073(-)
MRALRFLVAAFWLVAESSANDALQLGFRNSMPSDVELFWEAPDNGARHSVGTLPADGGILWQTTAVGHVFSYDDSTGERQRVTASAGHPFVSLGDGGADMESGDDSNDDEVRVRCSTTVGAGESFDILVRPHWSPLGAARFLDLVRQKYYDDCALTRVVPRFLTQLGIGADAQARSAWRHKTIKDDPRPWGVTFQPGMLSFAGGGPDSRTMEIFVVMPGAPPSVLANFGTNPWETPFGIVDTFAKPLEDSAVARWHSYGDLPPWGKGPDHAKIYPQDGYEYLRREFPKLDYLKKCWIVADSRNTGGEEM